EILLALAKRLERKARFAAFYAANAPKFRILNEILNRFLEPVAHVGLCGTSTAKTTIIGLLA
ncbi:MAG: hypothetical protein LBF74_13410, partial [Treponema sp.]|nr:hypothetical protein [Treponema sp.]